MNPTYSILQLNRNNSVNQDDASSKERFKNAGSFRVRKFNVNKHKHDMSSDLARAVSQPVLVSGRARFG